MQLFDDATVILDFKFMFNLIGRLTPEFRRLSVVSMPAASNIWLPKNKQKLLLCCADLNAEETEELLSFFNSDFDESEWAHWCVNGCCDDMSFGPRSQKCMSIAFGRYPDVPLLYRWKHFENALSFNLRGVLLHRGLPNALGQSLARMRRRNNIPQAQKHKTNNNPITHFQRFLVS
jgi:hypothetical protein